MFVALISETISSHIFVGKLNSNLGELGGSSGPPKSQVARVQGSWDWTEQRNILDPVNWATPWHTWLALFIIFSLSICTQVIASITRNYREGVDKLQVDFSRSVREDLALCVVIKRCV